MSIFKEAVTVIRVRYPSPSGKAQWREGAFDNEDDLNSTLKMLEADPEVLGIYIQLNETDGSAFKRYPNKLGPLGGKMTTDAEITRRRFLFLDFDAEKPAEISKDSNATDAEKAATVGRAKECVKYLETLGWKPQYVCDSGNGTHVLYNIDLPNNEQSKILVARTLETLNHKGYGVDTSVHNAGRITRYYGTMNRKGVPTQERPHRRSELKADNDEATLVTREMLVAFTSSDTIVVNGVTGNRHKMMKKYICSQRNLGVELTIDDAIAHGKKFKTPFGQTPEEAAEVADILRWANENIPLGAIDDREEIITTVAIHKMADSVVTKLIKQNETNPTIFVRGDNLTKVTDNNGHISLNYIDRAKMAGLISRRFKFMAQTSGAGGSVIYVETRCPKDVVEDVLNVPDNYDFPRVSAIVQCPILGVDGSITTGNMYSAEHEAWVTTDVEVNVPEDPTAEDVDKAIAHINDLLYDFPWKSPSDRSNAFGMLVTAVTQYLIPAKETELGKLYGRNPMFIITKNTPGCGGTYLAHLVSILSTGTLAGLISPVEREEELSKVITTLVKSGNTTVILDNWDGDDCNKNQLAAMLTADVWKGRILGQSKEICEPYRPLVVLTGNGVAARDDIARRSVIIAMVTTEERPGERDESKFRVPNLLATAIRDRGAYISDIFTIAKYWLKHRDFYHPSFPPMGSFEGWRDVVGGIMKLVDGDTPLFMMNKAAEVEEMDTDGQDFAEFLQEFVSQFGYKLVTSRDVKDWLTSVFKENAAAQLKLMGRRKLKVCRSADGQKIRLVNVRTNKSRGWMVETVVENQQQGLSTTQ